MDSVGGLQQTVGILLERFVSADGLTVDYQSLSGSSELKRCDVVTAALASLDPQSLGTRAERLAFWINLYNISALQLACGNSVREDVREAPGFFTKPGCDVGGLDFSLDDIEHGILRGNVRRAYRVFGQLRPWDARRRLILDPPEPRACFALVRCNRSSPPLRVYDGGRIEGQLHRASMDFISGGGVAIDRERDRIMLSQLLRTRARDFGGGQGVMRFIADHMAAPEDSSWVRSHAGKARVGYLEADWRLNKSQP